MADTFSKIDYKSLAHSEEGSAFIERFLHPPGVAIGPVNGIPDRNCTPSCVVNLREDFVIRPPALIAAGETWSCLLFSIPDVTTPYVFFVARDLATTPGNPLCFNTSVLSPVSQPSVATRSVLANLASATRTIGKSATVRLNAPALSDQGSVYAAQIQSQTDKQTATFNQLYPAVTPSSANPIQLYATGYRRDLSSMATLRGEGIAQMSSGSYTGQARDGCFMPMRYTDPSLTYTDTSNDSYLVTDSGSGVREVYPQFMFRDLTEGVTGTDTFLVLDTRAGVQNMFRESDATAWSSVNASKSCDGFSHMATGVMSFTGLSSNATLTVRHCETIEALVNTASSWSPFLTESANPDTMAMDNAYMVRQKMADAFPAAYNDFGSFFAGVKKLAPTLLNFATSAPGKALLSLAPGGGMINTVTSAIKDALESGQSNPPQRSRPIPAPRPRKPQQQQQQIERPVPKPRTKKPTKKPRKQ